MSLEAAFVINSLLSCPADLCSLGSGTEGRVSAEHVFHCIEMGPGRQSKQQDGRRETQAADCYQRVLEP